MRGRLTYSSPAQTLIQRGSSLIGRIYGEFDQGVPVSPETSARGHEQSLADALAPQARTDPEISHLGGGLVSGGHRLNDGEADGRTVRRQRDQQECTRGTVQHALDDRA